MLQYSDVNHHNFQEHILKMRRFRRLCWSTISEGAETQN